ncbi:MAG TPA: caspase family protein [Burkholderiales bacterium]|nr:caspase family protein [Burkholderiales bacterium]
MRWLVVLSAIVLPATAGAQRTLVVAPIETRVALVIGNGAYKDSPLANPVNDATDIARVLQSVGFKVILKRNASAREMRQAIREFGGELRRAEVGLFYFAGHGVQLKGNNYLVPVGADIESEADAEDLAIDATYALRTMEESQVKVSIVILDACRNNPFARSFRSSSRGLAQMTAATGSVIAFSTAPGSVAADGSGRNGVYTKHLLANLNQGDSDLLRVFQRTRAGVVKETGGKQTPWESTSLIGDFYFKLHADASQAAPVPSPAPAPAAAALAPGPVSTSSLSSSVAPPAQPLSVATVAPAVAARPTLAALRNRSFFGVVQTTRADWDVEVTINESLQPQIVVRWQNCAWCATSSSVTRTCKRATISPELAIYAECGGDNQFASRSISGVFPNLKLDNPGGPGAGGADFVLIDTSLKASFVAAKKQNPTLTTAEFSK